MYKKQDFQSCVVISKIVQEKYYDVLKLTDKEEKGLQSQGTTNDADEYHWN